MVTFRRSELAGEVIAPHRLPPLILALAGALGCGGGFWASDSSRGSPADGSGSDDGRGPDDGAGVGGGEDGDDGGATSRICPPVPACDAPLPDLGPPRDFRHTLSEVVVGTGFPNHRGRDLLLREGEAQAIIGKIAYGVVDKDLKDEEVDVWLLRGCGGAWEQLGTALTTRDDDHAAVEGVPDTGGRIYFDVPAGRALGPGRHRVHLSVAGDRTGADLFIQVVPEGIEVFVSDVDGTLTVGENEEFIALLEGELPAVNDGAAEALTALAGRGYLPLYLTARPEFLVGRTRELLAVNGFPPGLVHTTTDGIGAIGGDAAAFKSADLGQALTERGHVAAYSFGNTATDAQAYDAADVQPVGNRFFFAFDDEGQAGRRFDSYRDLVDELGGAPAPCQPSGL